MRKWQLTSCYSITITELWRDDKGILVERDHDKCRCFISNETLAKMYVEYKEPRKLEAWVNVVERYGKLEFGLTHYTKEKALQVATKQVIDTIKITWTEGQ